MAHDELRALDREIAELLGWKVVAHLPGRGVFGIVDPAGHLVSEGYAAAVKDCLWDAAPAYSSTWEGFGLLVEECERRMWLHETHYLGRYWESGETPTPCGRVSSPPPGAFWSFERTGNDIRHAFARATRDALRAAKDREG